MAAFKDITSQVFGRWAVIRYAYRKNNRTFWIVSCSCNGQEHAIDGASLTSGGTKSCG